MSKIFISIALLLSTYLSANPIEDKPIKKKEDSTLTANKRHAKACKNGNMVECTNLGILYYTGNGIEKNHKKAKKLFEKSCKKRYAKACYYLGTIYKRGANGIERNIRRSRMFYAFSCKIGYSPSCVQYNLIREKRELKGSGKNTVNSGYTYTAEVYGG